MHVGNYILAGLLIFNHFSKCSDSSRKMDHFKEVVLRGEDITGGQRNLNTEKFSAPTFPICPSNNSSRDARISSHEVFNFLGALPRAMEILGLGILFIRTVAIGTQFPLLYPIFIPLVAILSIGIYFIPIPN
ncbi:hypothetical protein Fcan01_20014 [Folsomia candida]|uniref:Uncharacterized protein n=1 Tax=Folsomia candida TaxID=158441 RepID=A0A226DI35_FOLCA|nr:hypothetical protein Fcan01_20014 [Folsomia candida]